MTHPIQFVCPKCRGLLQPLHAAAIRCKACAGEYPRVDYAHADFAGPEISFDDWWVETPEKKRHWLEVEAPKEEEYERGLAERYLLPLLNRLQYRAADTTVLSAGCGLGSDVDLLNDRGYNAWGIDCGNRVLGWHKRTHQDHLARADLRALPFEDEAFDFVLSLNTIEHVGTVGDSTKVTPDYLEQRMAALRSLLRVTKRGGYVLLSGLSRTIPFDFGHVQETRFVRIHSPWERFLLNYADVRKLCQQTGDVDAIEPLPLRGFFSWTTLREYRLVRPLLPAVDWLMGSLPNAVYGSWISPFWIALARRRAKASSVAA